MCGDLWEAYNRSYPPHSPSGRGPCTEVDVRGRHERGNPRSFGCSTTWSGWVNDALAVLPLPESSWRRRGSRGVTCWRSRLHGNLWRSCSGDTNTDSTNRARGHIITNLCFCIRWDLWVTYCILVCPGCESSVHYFSCSAGHGAVSVKSMSGHITLN
jgi:hypothetical protein